MKQSNRIFTHKKVVNIYIVYELVASSSHVSDPTLKNCLFKAVTLTKNVEIEKYKYSGMELDLIEDLPFHFLVGNLARMY